MHAYIDTCMHIDTHIHVTNANALAHTEMQTASTKQNKSQQYLIVDITIGFSLF